MGSQMLNTLRQNPERLNYSKNYVASQLNLKSNKCCRKIETEHLVCYVHVLILPTFVGP
jgi:hypothetical protein